ncbi:hypothetical protein ACHHYP_16939 [Achlya hypogyna]|uniref:PRA1 family protein n=1 Tax=Achlya hypogyna TaxID=1202772 RepID=A0A1V9ZDW4_ACHHY|nr:hypothetical protein ACHHYP_16939 [Achlya hypogyna]
MERTSSGKLGTAPDGTPDADELKIHSIVDQVVASVRKKINVHAIRSLFSFMGIGEEHPFTLLPKAQVLQRLRRNLEYFLVNYVLIFALIFFCVLIFHPYAMLSCVGTLAVWITVLAQRKQLQAMLGPSFPMLYIVYALAACTAFILAFSLLPSLLTATSITGVLGIVHALLRNTPASDKVDVLLEDHP